MMSLKSLFLSLALLAGLIICKGQNKVYFPYFELINMEKDAGLQYSASRLIKTYIENNHDYHILLPESTADRYLEKEPYHQSVDQAKSIGAGYILLGEIHHLQGSYIVSLGLYETENGNKIWHDLIKGRTEEDLDPLLSRLGRSFMTKSTAQKEAEIDEVTVYEQQGVELMQIHVNHFIGAMLGGVYLFGENTLSGFGISYTYDATSVLFNMNFEFYPTSNILQDEDRLARQFQHGNFNLGVLYPLSRKRMTWFLQGGMEYGITRVTRDDPFLGTVKSGVGFFAGGGYLINRNSTVNLRIHAAVTIPTYVADGQHFPGLKFGLTTSFSKR